MTTTTEKENAMTTTPTITVHADGHDLQTAATTQLLDRSGINYALITGQALSVVHVDTEGITHQWTGFRPDRLADAVADLKAAA